MRRLLASLVIFTLLTGPACATLTHLGETETIYGMQFQRGEYDCAIAAMAIFGRVMYDDVLKVLTPEEVLAMDRAKGFPVTVSPNPAESMQEIVAVLERLWMKRQYAATRDFDVQKDTGLLLISFQVYTDDTLTTTMQVWHTVVIHKGMVYDPSPNGPTVPVPVRLYGQVTGFIPDALIYDINDRQ